MRIKVIAGFAALLANISIANAADTITHIQQKPPAFNWAGFYAGAEAGTSSNKFKFIGQGAAGLFHQAMHQPMAGLYAGYNLQLRQHVIISAEENVDFLRAKQLKIFNLYAADNTVIGQGYELYKQQWTADTRFRLGYALGNFMPYVAGGMSVIRGKAVFGRTENGINSDKERGLDNYLGWNLGTGMDYALPHNLIFRAEYNLRKTQNHQLLFLNGNDFVNSKADGTLKSQQLRIGAAYKF